MKQSVVSFQVTYAQGIPQVVHALTCLLLFDNSST